MRGNEVKAGLSQGFIKAVRCRCQGEGELNLEEDEEWGKRGGMMTNSPDKAMGASAQRGEVEGDEVLRVGGELAGLRKLLCNRENRCVIKRDR